MQPVTGRRARELDPRSAALLASFGGTWVVLLDDTSRIVHELATRDVLFGGPPDVSSIGRRIAAFVHPDDMLLAVDRMEESLAMAGSDISFQIRAGNGDGAGDWTLVSVRAVNLLDDQGLNGIVLAINPATARA